MEAKGAEALATHLRRQIGKRVEVLSERGGVARARDFTLVKTPGVEAGRLFEVDIIGADNASLLTSDVDQPWSPATPR